MHKTKITTTLPFNWRQTTRKHTAQTHFYAQPCFTLQRLVTYTLLLLRDLDLDQWLSYANLT